MKSVGGVEEGESEGGNVEGYRVKRQREKDSN